MLCAIGLMVILIARDVQQENKIIEEQEPNDYVSDANNIAFESTIRGRISTKEDRGYFVFTVPNQVKNIRIILRKNFGAVIKIYDENEKLVINDDATSDNTISLAFDIQQKATQYLIVVRSTYSVEVGDYEMVVR